MADLEAENRRLREELETLKEEKRQREYSFDAAVLPREWGLTRNNRQVLFTFLRRPLQTQSRADLMAAIDRIEGDPHYVTVMICLLRKKLAKYDIEIISEHGLGYRLTPESVGIIQAAISQSSQQEMQRIETAAKLYASKTPRRE